MVDCVGHAMNKGKRERCVNNRRAFSMCVQHRELIRDIPDAVLV